MDLQLKGKKVVVTGASRGIGRAIAGLFAEEGADIALCARNEQTLRDASAMLKDYGVKVIADAVDVADHNALQAWIVQAANELGGIDVVVANPSAFGVGNALSDWQTGFAVDLMGTIHTIDAAMPYLEQSAASGGAPAALIISSALVAEAEMASAYGAYKAALVHYTKGVARQFAPKGIRVNAISPGTIYVDDGFWGNAKRHMPDLYEAFFKRNPMGRMGNPEEVANAAAFLCSPQASFITGVNLLVDGAWTTRVNY